jgi:hypothetical protein
MIPMAVTARKLKLFTTQGVAVVPHEWMQRVAPGTHRIQGHVAIYAATKADAMALLIEAGLSQWSADSVTKQLRLDTRGGGESIRALVEAEVIDPGQRGAYFWREGHADDAVIRIDDAGLPIVAHFRYRNPLTAEAGQPTGIYAEAVK